ncbi:hypothetical protein GQ53DRAFT_781050 [Thozetella sp. PMI_491]|nr:hypothetical protein GQ53DRAFT_781050 [Thozetella sp. PMI_491]
MAQTPDLLYHTTLTIVDHLDDTGGVTEKFYVLGTHGSIYAAKEYSKKALQLQGFSPDDFSVFEERSPAWFWYHGDNTTVYAQTPEGQEFLVGFDTGINSQNIKQSPDGILEIPDDETHLHYVVRSEINYDRDNERSPYKHEIEGCYARQDDAYEAARKCIREKKDIFTEYHERSSLDHMPEWPFGKDVLVHAVGQMGEDFTVAVKTVPGIDETHTRIRPGRRRKSDIDRLNRLCRGASTEGII